MRNKRGFIGITIATTAGLIIFAMIIFMLLFGIGYILTWLSSNFLLIIGSIVIILGMIFAVAKAGDKLIPALLIILFVGGGLIVLNYSGFIEQSFLGVSEMKTDDGKGYWLISGVADSIGDKAEFIQKLPSEGELPDGTKVEPTKPLKLSISKGTQQCEYSLIPKTSKIYVGLFTKKDIKYYELTSPSRVINAVFSDDRGNSQEVDGTTNQILYFYDIDDKGLATIKTLKSTSGKMDCPLGSDVAILRKDENPSEFSLSSNIVYVDKPELVQFIKDRDSFFSTSRLFGDSVRLNEPFIRTFSNGELKLSSIRLIGTGIDIGDVLYTITADRDYFDSVITTPAKPAIPFIKDVLYSGDIVENSDSSIKVIIGNNGESGIVNIKLTSDSFSFGTSAQDITLDEVTTFTTTIKAQKKVLNNAEINIKVCGTSQVGRSSCDEKTIEIDITAEEDKSEEKCGDGICQDFENNLVCPSDCKKGDNNGDGDGDSSQCSWYQEPYEKEVKDYGLLGWRHIFNNPKTHIETGCKTTGWVYLSIMGGFLTIIIIILVLTKSKSRKRR